MAAGGLPVDRVGRADRAVRPRAARRHRRPQRVDPADRAAHRRGRRARASPPPGIDRAGHGDAGRRRRHRPRRVPARAGPHAVLGPGGVGRRARCGRAASTTASSSRSAARRPTSPASSRAGRRCRTSQVASHATALRAVDVRVIGVAGGSMLRRAARQGVRRRAPHARTSPGCPYACFTDATRLDGARAVTDRAPRPATPTTTSCSRSPTAPARAHQHLRGERARRSPSPATTACGRPGGARRRVRGGRRARSASPATRSPGACSEASAQAVGELVAARRRRRAASAGPSIVAVGGGAGGLGRHVAADDGLRVRRARPAPRSSRRSATRCRSSEPNASGPLHEFDPRVAVELAAEVENEVRRGRCGADVGRGRSSRSSPTRAPCGRWRRERSGCRRVHDPVGPQRPRTRSRPRPRRSAGATCVQRDLLARGAAHEGAGARSVRRSRG